jgi:hypothetical protein
MNPFDNDPSRLNFFMVTLALVTRFEVEKDAEGVRAASICLAKVAIPYDQLVAGMAAQGLGEPPSPEHYQTLLNIARTHLTKPGEVSH